MKSELHNRELWTKRLRSDTPTVNQQDDKLLGTIIKQQIEIDDLKLELADEKRHSKCLTQVIDSHGISVRRSGPVIKKQKWFDNHDIILRILQLVAGARMSITNVLTYAPIFIPNGIFPVAGESRFNNRCRVLVSMVVHEKIKDFTNDGDDFQLLHDCSTLPHGRGELLSVNMINNDTLEHCSVGCVPIVDQTAVAVCNAILDILDNIVDKNHDKKIRLYQKIS